MVTVPLSQNKSSIEVEGVAGGIIGAGNQIPRTPPADQKVKGELKLIKMISDELLGTDSSLTKPDQIMTSEKGMSLAQY